MLKKPTNPGLKNYHVKLEIKWGLQKKVVMYKVN